MLLAARIKLEPTPEQHNLLKDTLAQANQVCNRISHQAFTQGFSANSACTNLSIILLVNTFHFLRKWSLSSSR